MSVLHCLRETKIINKMINANDLIEKRLNRLLFTMNSAIYVENVELIMVLRTSL